MDSGTDYTVKGELLPGLSREEIAQFGQGFGMGLVVAGAFGQVAQAIEAGAGSFVDGFVQAVSTADMEALAAALETARKS